MIKEITLIPHSTQNLTKKLWFNIDIGNRY